MIKLTACVIVKNEAKNIESWLRCMEQIADEIIVVDTGSTDATKELVRASQAKLYDYAWTGDFAAAKNYALSKAHGNWIAFLDADETFTAASLRRIPRLLRELHPQVRIAGVMCRLVNVDTSDRNRFIGATVQLRLFRNLSTLRYQGRIHEALTVPKNRMVELVKDVEIIHTGYSSALVKRKLQRNLDLLEQKIASQQGQPTPRDVRYLMDCYYGLADYPKAIECADRALAQIDAMPDALAHIHMMRVSAHLFGKEATEDVLRVMDEAITACPDAADFPMMKGLYIFQQKDYLGSEQCLAQAFALQEAYQLDVEGVSDNLERFLPSAWWVRGRIAHLRGAEEEAREDYVKALQSYRYHEASLRALVRSLMRAGVAAADIIGLLAELYDAGDADFLAEVLQHEGGQVFLYYEARARKKHAARAYLAAGRYDAAAAEAADELAWLYGCGVADALAEGIPSTDKLQLLLPPAYRAAWQAGERGERAQGKVADSIERLRGCMQQEKHAEAEGKNP
ncbi:MAG: glycosyltransferase [Selenomonas sp.]